MMACLAPGTIKKPGVPVRRRTGFGHARLCPLPGCFLLLLLFAAARAISPTQRCRFNNQRPETRMKKVAGL